MTSRSLLSLFVIFLLVAAAGIAAVSLNILLLDRASAGNDPIGRLTPRAHLPMAPHWTVRPAKSNGDDGTRDD